MRFITDVIDDKIIVFKQKKNDIVERLKVLEYPLNIDNKHNPVKNKKEYNLALLLIKCLYSKIQLSV